MKYFLYNKISKKIEEINKNDVIKKLYSLKYLIPDKKIFDKETNKDIIDYFNKYSIKKIKKSISFIDNYIPLYDILLKNIFIFDKTEIYNKVMSDNYRFPGENIKELIEETKNSLEIKKNNKDEMIDLFIINCKKMIEFLDNFNLKIYYLTYIKIFYEYSYIGNSITFYKNYSYSPYFNHIKPYLSRKEVIYLSLNYGIVDKIDENNLDEITILWKKLKNYSIKDKNILLHKKYIYDKNIFSIIRFYTFKGSMIYNKYLRGLNYNKNKHLENQIKFFKDIILKSPSLPNKLTLFRFVKTDSFLKDIKINDFYISDSFMSTTRNPFYKSDLYNFGYILLKINIPEKVNACLLIESISMFPEEEEVIFPPGSKFKLIKINDNCVYYSENKYLIKTKYEFEWVENVENVNNIIVDKKIETEFNIIDFLEIKDNIKNNLELKIDIFMKKYLNEFNEFIAIIDNKNFIITCDNLDSIDSSYGDFYSIKTSKGLTMHCFYNNNIIFFLEIGINENIPELRVNYNLRYNDLKLEKIIKIEEFIKFISSISYYFNLHDTIIYGEYHDCFKDDKNNTLLYYQKNKSKTNESYCLDFYNYFKFNIKRFNNIREVYPKFSYFELDRLKEISPSKILDNNNNLLTLVYEIYLKDNKDNIGDLFIWLKDNRCYVISELINNINKITKDNPFINDYYRLDHNEFLYNKEYITSYPIDMFI